LVARVNSVIETAERTRRSMQPIPPRVSIDTSYMSPISDENEELLEDYELDGEAETSLGADADQVLEGGWTLDPPTSSESDISRELARAEAARIASAALREQMVRRAGDAERALAAECEAAEAREQAARETAEARAREEAARIAAQMIEREELARRAAEAERALAAEREAAEAREQAAREAAEARAREEAARIAAEIEREELARRAAEAERALAAEREAAEAREQAAREAAEVEAGTALKARLDRLKPASPVLTTGPSRPVVPAAAQPELACNDLELPAGDIASGDAGSKSLGAKSAMAKDGPSRNQRRDKRVASQMPVVLWRKGLGHLSCMLRDRSSSGARLEFRRDQMTDGLSELLLDDTLTLMMSSAQEKTSVDCVVVWVTGNRCGVRFLGQFRTEVTTPRRPVRSNGGEKSQQKSGGSRWSFR
jgi:hypothetical protein